MIEKIVYDFLKKNIGKNVYMEKPCKAYSDIIPFILIEKTGGSVSNHISHATISIRSYGATLFKAAELNETVKSAMSEITSLINVSSCALNSDYNFTDVTTKQYRYQAVFNITYMEDK